MNPNNAFAGLFDQSAAKSLILDVRSPSEYNQAHIPGALSLPLFTDEERARIGTAYKQVSREAAIKIGLDCFGPNMRSMVERVEAWQQEFSAEQLVVHCWRGGMRSAAVGWLLKLYGFQVHILPGGYKAFRRWVLSTLEHPHQLCVIGGYTGSGKTRVLEALHSMGEAVIDLEALAGHRGSAFGNLGLPPQPSAEQFENNIAAALATIFAERPEEPSCIWIEDESRRIGNVNLYFRLYETMLAAPMVFLDIPFEERLNEVIDGYGKFSIEKLQHAVGRISRRLGGLQTSLVQNMLQEGNLEEAFSLLLKYYDRFYEKSTFFHERNHQKLILADTDAVANAQKILSLKNALTCK